MCLPPPAQTQAGKHSPKRQSSTPPNCRRRRKQGPSHCRGAEAARCGAGPGRRSRSAPWASASGNERQRAVACGVCPAPAPDVPRESETLRGGTGCGVCGGSPCSLGGFPVNPNLLQKSRCTDNNNLRQEGRALVLHDPDTRAFRTPLRAPPEPQVWPQDREQGPLSTVGYLRTHGASGCPGDQAFNGRVGRPQEALCPWTCDLWELKEGGPGPPELPSSVQPCHT